MSKYASKVIKQAQKWIGKKESDGSHKSIIDLYNSHRPLARGYKVQYTDAWCATFVSAVSIKLGYTDIIPTECGCEEMINLFKKLGAWEEKDNYKPTPGCIIFYDWQDDGNGNNKGWSDHVGIVEAVSGSAITVIEGNYDNSVKRRYLVVNDRFIRGYGVPHYNKEETPSKNENTYVIQSGDTLSAIAKKYGITVDAILKANCEIKDANSINVGQVIDLPVTVSNATPDYARIGKLFTKAKEDMKKLDSVTELLSIM